MEPTEELTSARARLELAVRRNAAALVILDRGRLTVDERQEIEDSQAEHASAARALEILEKRLLRETKRA